LRYMTDQGVARQLKLSELDPSAFDVPFSERCRQNIRDEIRLPDMLSSEFVAFVANGKILFLSAIAIREYIGAIEHEIGIVKNVHDQWSIRHCQE